MSCFPVTQPWRAEVLTAVLDGDAAPLDVILVPGVAFDKDCNRVSFDSSQFLS